MDQSNLITNVLLSLRLQNVFNGCDNSSISMEYAYYGLKCTLKLKW